MLTENASRSGAMRKETLFVRFVIGYALFPEINAGSCCFFIVCIMLVAAKFWVQLSGGRS